MKNFLKFCLTLNVVLSAFLPVLAQEIPEELTVFIHQAQYQKALDIMDSLPENKELLVQKATCYKALNNYLQATHILEKLSEENPSDIPLKLDLAFCYKEMSRYPQSIACYDSLIQLDSTNMYFQIQKADLLCLLQKYSPAIQILRNINLQHPSTYLYKKLGMCFEKTYQTDSALVYYSKALEMEPDDYPAAISQIKMYLKKEDYASALEQTERYIAKDTANTQLHFLNAFSYYNLDRYEEAVQRFEKCLAKGDSSLMVLQGLGISYYFLENNKKAQPYLSQAYVLDTTNQKVLYPLAITSYETGRYKEAIQYYTSLLRIHLPNVKALFNLYAGLARSCEKEGRYQDAANCYSKSLQHAAEGEEMEILYARSNLFEHQLHDYMSAHYSFKEYRLSLFNYQMNLKDSVEADEIEEKLKALDEHIKELKTKGDNR